MVLIVRLLVYMMLARVLTDKGLSRHLRKHPRIAEGLGFKTIPHRTTIGRWRKRYGNIVPTEIEIVDSTQMIPMLRSGLLQWEHSGDSKFILE